MKVFLSKSQFLKWLQCPKALWLLKNAPGLATPPSPARREVMRLGTEVGLLARRLFPGGREVVYRKNLETMLRDTAMLMEAGERVIYEAAFRHRGLLVLLDILRVVPAGLEVYEVKSSTALKDFYIYDLALQGHVLRGLGLPLKRLCLVHINGDYVRRGDIEVEKLFTVEDLTKEAEGEGSFVEREINEIGRVIAGPCPEIEIGKQCTEPYECDFIGHCWKDVPERSVFELKGRGPDRFALYRAGIRRLEDLDASTLPPSQRMQVEAERTGEVLIDREAIRTFLSELVYPHYYLDFETFSEPIPPFDGTRPYEQIPFQFSLHTRRGPDSEPVHHGFLAGPGRDSRLEMAERLTGLIPPGGTVVVYNAAFERSILEKLAVDFPAHAAGLLAIAEGLRDLMVPFRRRDYYTKEMQGSYSLKYVLPALVPGMDYSGLAVKNGEEASIYFRALRHVSDEVRAAAIKKDLLEYCRLDTLGLVKIVEKLRQVAWP